jgi:Squalene-hopene cyclase C-terminal domain/Prenyltransferase and squalene oxidase repeat
MVLRTALSVLCALSLIGCDRGVDAASKKGEPQDATTKPSSAPEPQAPGTGSWKDQAKAASDRGIRYLTEHRTADGKWAFNSKVPPDLGITSLCLLAMLESPRKYRESDGPFVREGIEWIASSQKADGSIHGGMLATYNTSVAILALVATQNPKYKPIIDRAVEYLRVVQADEGEKYQPSDRYYGGVGYGGDERPDGSNTQFAIEAARAGGMKDDDPFLKKTTTFLQRMQNRSESNDLQDKDVVPGNDGGGFYSPGVNPGEAKAGMVTLPDGKKIRRSYGSMSYALLKSYLFCNIDVKDPRVQALIDWLSKNYRLDYNPGMEGSSDKPEARYSALYYYYLSMARTLASAKGDILKDETGKPRNWREDLAKAIIALQRPDGSWANDRNKDFWEDSPMVATAMALNALNACLK